MMHGSRICAGHRQISGLTPDAQKADLEYRHSIRRTTGPRLGLFLCPRRRANMEERKMPLNGNTTEEQHAGGPAGALDSDSNVGENMNYFTKRGACAACGGTGRTGFVHLGWQRDKRGVPHPAGCIGRLRCPECDASSPEDAARLREDIALIERNYDEWRAVDPDTLDEQMCDGCGDELVTRPQTLCPSCEELRADRAAGRGR